MALVAKAGTINSDGEAHIERPARRRSRLRRRSMAPYLFVLPSILFIIAFLIYPVLYNVQISFENLGVTNLLRGGAHWVGFANYRAVIHDPEFTTAVEHSLVLTIVSVTLQLGIGLLLALLHNRRFFANSFVRAMYLVAYAIPVVVVGAVFRWLLDGQFGFVNWALRSIGLEHTPIFWLVDLRTALGAVIAINVWIGIPFNFVIILAGLKGIPQDMLEAANLDGAGSLARFRYVTLPMLRPTLLAAGVLGVIFTFKMFDLIWVTTRGGPAHATDVLPTYAYNLVFQQFLFGKGAAVLNVMFVILFAISLIYLRSLRRGEEEA